MQDGNRARGTRRRTEQFGAKRGIEPLDKGAALRIALRIDRFQHGLPALGLARAFCLKEATLRHEPREQVRLALEFAQMYAQFTGEARPAPRGRTCQLGLESGANSGPVRETFFLA